MIPYIKTTINTTVENIKNSSRKIIALNTIDFLLVLFITILFYLTLPIESKRVVFIPKGSTSNAISYLNENGYSLNFMDRVALFFIGYTQSGWIDMEMKNENTKISKLDFLYKLTTSKAAMTKVVLIPGETYYFFLNELSEKLKLPKDELFKVYNELAYKKDGNILSQTYNLPVGMNPKDLLTYLFQYTEDEYKKYSMKIFGKYNKEEWYKYIAIASVIQKESGSRSEMSQVSGVVYNRLAQKMKLQMDGTLNYGPYSHMKVTPTMIANDESSYNTYKFAGIPSDPVCAVEFEAIKAALFPTKSSFLFFMKKADGSGHSFAKDFSDHKANIEKVIEVKKKVETTSILPTIENKTKEAVSVTAIPKVQKEKPKEIIKEKTKEQKKETTANNTNQKQKNNEKQNVKSSQKDVQKEALKTKKTTPLESKSKDTKKELKADKAQEKQNVKSKVSAKEKVTKDSNKLHKETIKEHKTSQKTTKEIWKTVQ